MSYWMTGWTFNIPKLQQKFEIDQLIEAYIKKPDSEKNVFKVSHAISVNRNWL